MRIGIDLGGTKVEAIALGDDGKELKRMRVVTPSGDYGGTIAAICQLVRELEKTTECVGSIGVGIPGTVVASTGLVKNENTTWINNRKRPVLLSITHNSAPVLWGSLK